MRAVFTTQGAVLKSWQLRKYTRYERQAAGTDPAGSAGRRASTSVHADDRRRQVTAALASARVRAERRTADARLGARHADVSVRDADGVNARKTFYFQPDGQPYVLNSEVSVDQAGAPKPVTIDFGPAVGLGYDPDGAHADSRRRSFLDGSVDARRGRDVSGAAALSGRDALRRRRRSLLSVAAALPGRRRSQVDYRAVTRAACPGRTDVRRARLIAFSSARIQAPRRPDGRDPVLHRARRTSISCARPIAQLVARDRLRHVRDDRRCRCCRR